MSLSVSLRQRLSEPPRSLWVLWLLTIVVMSGASFALPLHRDTAWEITLAQRCVQEGRCADGVPASLPGTTHGAFILRLIELVILLKLPWATLRLLTTAFMAAAVVVAAQTVRTFFRWPLSWLAYALMILVVSVRFSSSIVWNVSPHPFFCALFTLGLLRALESGRVRDVMLCTGALGLAIDTELAAVLVLPLTCGLLFASVTRRWLSILAGVAALIAGPLLFSGPVWIRNFQVVVTQHQRLLIVAAVAVAFSMGLGAWLRPRWTKLTAYQRALVAMVLLVILVQGSTAVASDLGVRGGSQTWYLGASWASELLLVFAAWHAFAGDFRGRMILPGNLLGIALVLFLFVDNATHGASMWRSLQRGTVPAWSVDEVDHLARFLGAQGMSQTSAARHLWISQSDEVVKHLMNFLPETDEKPYTGPDFLVLKPSGPIPELPQGWSAIPLGWGRQALVHTFYSQLDMAPLHVKVAVEGSEERQVNTTKLEWQANEERGRIGLSGSAMRDTDTVTYQLDRTPPRSTRIFLPILPEDRPRMRVVSAAGATPCHVALDREHSVVLAGSLIHFPDLIEIEPRDRDFLKGALPELDWTGCL